MSEPFDINQWLATMKEMGQEDNKKTSSSSSSSGAPSGFGTASLEREQPFDFNLFLCNELQKTAELMEDDESDSVDGDSDYGDQILHDNDNEEDKDEEDSRRYPVLKLKPCYSY